MGHDWCLCAAVKRAAARCGVSLGWEAARAIGWRPIAIIVEESKRRSPVFKRGALSLAVSTIGAVLLQADPARAFSWDAMKTQSAIELVRDFQTAHKVPSISNSAAINGEAVLAKDLGADGSVAADGKEVRYRIASVTKQFTAAAILALIEDGTVIPKSSKPLTLDTRLGEIFPKIDPKSELGRIIVRQLLTMTSNLPNFTNDPLFYDPGEADQAPATKPIGTLELIEHLRKYKPIKGKPTFIYSNTNYFALAMIIAVLKRDGYPPQTPPISVVRDYMRDRLFARAGMTMSGFLGEKAPAGTVDARPNHKHVPMFHTGAWAEGAGDIVSTVSDVTRWNIALMSGKILNEAMLQTMLTPASPVVTSAGPYKGWRYAMGWYVLDMRDYRLYQHDGIFSGFRASNAIGRKSDGSWMSATVLADIDLPVDFVRLVRRMIEIGN
jgi:D-alanyl-D-alanine carboxypeptidase